MNVATLFRWMPPEAAHHTALNSLKWASKLRLTSRSYPRYQDPINLWGIHFPNRVGLAAGFDKNGAFVDALDSLGFGFIEVGTVTPVPQNGNRRPRLFRLPERQALINRMGFNNDGIDCLIQNLKNRSQNSVVGISIGRNAHTTPERSIDDYRICLQRAYNYADYIAINISSPNTSGLRSLQFAEFLLPFLKELKYHQSRLERQHRKYVPFLVKISPDLSEEEVTIVARSLLECRVDGVIATNTTVERPGVEHVRKAQEKGGLSGRPLYDYALAKVRTLAQVIEGRIPIIGCGGIMSPEQAADYINSGATLVQLYTGLVYAGPNLIWKAAQSSKEAAFALSSSSVAASPL